MALSFDTYAGDAVTTNFSVTFEYISDTHVNVYLDGVLQTITTHYTWFNSTTIQFVAAPGSGVVVRIERATPNTARLVDFQDAGNLTEADLDTDSNQNFFIAQEITDGFDAEALKLDVDDKWDGETKVIKNVVDPTADQDVATKKFADDLWAANLATVAAGVAATAADVVTTNADVVLTNADVVLTHADVVLTNADAAATAADLVQTNLDQISCAANEVLTDADATATAADAVSTAADAVSTAADVAATALAVLVTNADAISTAADAVATAADLVLTDADQISCDADATAAAASAAAAAASAASIDSALMLNRKNMVINGSFQVKQRGASFVSPATGDYTLDRWQFLKATTAGAVTVTRPISIGSDRPFRASMQVDVTTADASVAAGDLLAFTHAIEGSEVSHLRQGTANASTITLGFWHAHTKTGTHSVAFMNANLDRSYVAEYTQAVADTWEQSTVTLTCDVAGTWVTGSSQAGLMLAFPLMSGSTFQTTADAWTAGKYYSTAASVNDMDNTANVFRIANVQLEENLSATEFEHLSYHETEQLCKRYFQMSYEVGKYPGDVTWRNVANHTFSYSSTEATGMTTRLAPEMGDTPTITWYDPVGGTINKTYDITNATSRTVSANKRDGANSTGYPDMSGSRAANTEMSGHWTAEAEIT